MNEEFKINKVPLYCFTPPNGITLLSWGTTTTETMTKEQYEKIFGTVYIQETRKVEYLESKQKNRAAC